MILIKVWLNAWLFWSFVVFTVVYTPIFAVMVSAGRLFSSGRVTMRRFRKAVRLYGRVLVFFLPLPFLRVVYRDKGAADTQEKGPYIIICNHRSSSDPFLMACLPYEVVQVVNDWPFRLPFLGVFALWAGYLNVREMPPDEFAARCKYYIGKGVSLVVFPEGTRSGNRQMGQFHGAVFRAALEMQVPIIPLCISGNEDKPPRGSVFLNPGVIRIHKLPAICPPQYAGYSSFKLKNMIRDIIVRETVIMDGQL
ncbi:MAG: lysophospholipid acyltransferase family protein [Candidatus Omnitrophica bacterium]|nr:lysophospholipid acyltransferase family protein [Candidatus Omnitrophota bacterium]